jgi:hypothetical protein
MSRVLSGPVSVVDHSRRRFLTAAGGGVLLAACGGGSAHSASGASSGGGAAFSVLPNTFDFIAGVDQRVAIALADSSGNPITPDAPVTLRIGAPGAALGAEIPMAMHNQGVPAYLLTSYTFPLPGNYTLRTAYKGHHADFTAPVIAPTSTPIPFAGRPLIDVPTPTPAQPLGVNPICTAQPPCPFHSVSLDRALAEHRPVALQFATPALCQSRLCGPVLQNLVDVHAPFGDRVTFIHAEIYTDLSGQQGTPPVLAYHLQHEPLLLLAGADGVVRERIDNGYDRAEATSALQRLVSS